MKVENEHVLKAIATLLAMQQYNGTKDDKALMHCQIASEELAFVFALAEQLKSKPSSPHASELNTQLWLGTLKTAKLLGHFPGEAAGVPTAEWIDQLRKKGGDSDWETWWHRFSKN